MELGFIQVVCYSDSTSELIHARHISAAAIAFIKNKSEVKIRITQLTTKV